MIIVPKELEEIAARVDDATPPVVTLRQLWRWFSLDRSSVVGNHQIQQAIDHLGVLTIPPIKGASPETPLTLRRNGVARPSPCVATHVPLPPGGACGPPGTSGMSLSRGIDATLRLRHCVAIFGKLYAVAPEDTIERAVSLLSLHHCELLAVLKNPRSALGVIGWRQLGEARLRTPSPTTVNVCAYPAPVVSHDTSLLDALPIAEREGSLLVHGNDRSIVALLTPADLLRAVRQIAAPFLYLDEIERRLRALLADRAPEALKATSSRTGHTLGDYLRVLENPGHWEQLKLPMDRALVAQQLDHIRNVRNRCMHFSPEGLRDEEVHDLREFLEFLQKIHPH